MLRSFGRQRGSKGTPHQDFTPETDKYQTVRHVHLLLRDARMAPAIPMRSLVVFDRALKPTPGDVIAVAIPTLGYDIGRFAKVGTRLLLTHDNENFPGEVGISSTDFILGSMESWHHPEPDLFDQLDRDSDPACIIAKLEGHDSVFSVNGDKPHNPTGPSRPMGPSRRPIRIRPGR